MLGRLHAAPTLQWRRNLLLRRLAGFGDRSHHACSLIGANVALQLRRCLAVHRIRSAPTLASDVVVKPPVEQSSSVDIAA